MKNYLRQSESGFTIIEVLVGAVIFMLGFSLLVALLNGTIVKFAIDELDMAGDIGSDFITRAAVQGEVGSCDTIVVRDERHFRVVRQVTIDKNLTQILVTVSRQKHGKQLVQFYTETITTRQP